jgi:hypothetical protein
MSRLTRPPARVGLLALLPLLLAQGPSPDRALTQVRGPATATLSGDRVGKAGLEVRLSGEARLVLQVEGRPPLEVEVPEKLTRSEAWRVHPGKPAATSPLGDGRTRWRQEFDLEPLQKGKHDLALEPLRCREAGGPWQELTWKPLPVVVTTQVTRADVGEARDITAIEELPPEPSWPAWLLVVPAALAGVVLAVVVWLLRRRRLPQALPLTPEQAALCELARAEALPLACPRDVERYHTLLSDVVRRYLERRFHLPASRQTTAEFLEAMGRSPQLGAEPQALLRDFLGRCDLAKFAPVTPPPAECRAAAALARGLVEKPPPEPRGPAP